MSDQARLAPVSTAIPSALQCDEGQVTILRKPSGDDALAPAIILSVIISTYNARDVVADCLRSIYQNPPRERYEIILVDDASTDGTSEMVRACFPEVRLLRNEVNRHYTTSNNWAIDLARGEFLYLLNNDTIVLPQALDRMIGFLREDPEAGAVGSKLLNEDGTTQWSVRSLPDLGSALFGGRSMITRMFPNNRYSRKRLLHNEVRASEPFIAGYVSGASKMMPRKVVDQVGKLDSDFFYHVDADYCKRMADLGYKTYYLPTATVIHLHHKGGTMVSPRLRFRSMASFHFDCWTYYRKHLRQPASVLVRALVPIGLIFHLIVLAAIQSCAELIRVARRSRSAAWSDSGI
jgi:N-acetylglucosaminyl-diphospho-decaprenol L-rhamnosyltransferase